MNSSSSRASIALALLLLLVVNAAATAQFGDIFKKKKKEQPAQSEQKPAENKDDKKADEKKSDGGGGSLFGVKGATGSKQSSDTTAMGFSGVGPDGKVTAEALKVQPTPADFAEVQQVANTVVKHEDLQKFVEEGKLKVRQ